MLREIINKKKILHGSYFEKIYDMIVIRLLCNKFNKPLQINNGRPEYDRCQEAALKARLSAERSGGFG